MSDIDYAQMNADAVDRWVAGGWQWGTPVDHEVYAHACAGDWSILLTPTRPVPRSWYPDDLHGVRVLGLASGGGQQMPLLTAAGARCTVLDYAPSQLECERLVAKREGYDIEIVQADMSKPLPFADESFDLIIHPVSNCYVREVLPIWRECFRVLTPGGRLLSGLDNGFNYVGDMAEEHIELGLPFDPASDPALLEWLAADDSGVQFSHTLDEQIRGQLQAGFMLLDCYEDTNGTGRLHELGIPSFWATCARKPR